MPPAHQLGRPALVPPSMPAGRGWSGDLLCCGLSLPVVSSDSDSDSDLSSSSLEDRLPPTGVRDRKGDKPWKESGKVGSEMLLIGRARCTPAWATGAKLLLKKKQKRK